MSIESSCVSILDIITKHNWTKFDLWLRQSAKCVIFSFNDMNIIICFPNRNCVLLSLYVMASISLKIVSYQYIPPDNNNLNEIYNSKPHEK